MDLKAMAIKLAMDKLGGGDEGKMDSALGSLFDGGGDGGFDLGSLVNQFSSGGLAGAVQSWLGDGDNEGVSADQLTNALGADKVAGFAQQLGIGQDEAANKLTDLIPDLLDKSSSGGSLLSSAADLAARFLK